MIVQIGASAIGTLLALALIVLVVEARMVVRWRKRLNEQPHAAVLTELSEPHAGERPWAVTCGHRTCQGKTSVHVRHGAASVWARGHEDNPDLFPFPPPERARHKKGAANNVAVD